MGDGRSIGGKKLMGYELAGLRRDDKRARACATRGERTGGHPRGATGCAFRFGTTGSYGGGQGPSSSP